MNEKQDGLSETLRELTAEIVASYVSNNSVHRSDLAATIGTVHEALSKLTEPAPAAPVEKPTPPVSIRKSVTPDYLISLEDGRRYKSLRRHLASRGLTPEQYRQKWELPRDYPMTAPNYSAMRSQLAKSLGLGRKAAKPAPAKRGARRRAA